MRNMFAVAILVVLMSAAQAQEQARNYVNPEFKAPPAASLIVLAPKRDQTEQIAEGEQMLLRQLHAQLTKAGYRVLLLDTANHDAMWEEEVKAVGGLYDPVSGNRNPVAYAKVLGSLARRVGDGTKASILLYHSLVMRQTQLGGTKAEWDGQVRLVPTARTFGSDYVYSGNGSGLSVELLALTTEGDLAFRTYGGTSLPYRIDAGRSDMELRKDLFASDKETAEGVAIALRPLTDK